MTDLAVLDAAVRELGTALAHERLSFSLVAVGGWALARTGFIARGTQDIDVVGQLRQNKVELLDPLPVPLLRLAKQVALVFDLDEDWINPGPSFLLRLGLPPGFETRLTPIVEGGLTIYLPDRTDFIFMKAYAAIVEPHTRHGDDLRALSPSRDELRDAGIWAFRRALTPEEESRARSLASILEDI